MNPAFGSTLKGAWGPGKEIVQLDDMGGGHCTAVDGTATRVVLRQPRPGLHPLYFGTQGSYLHWDESEWSLHRKLRGLGVTRPEVQQLCGGMVASYNGRQLLTGIGEDPLPPNHDPGSMEAAQTQFASRLLYAVRDLYERDGRSPVALMLSGGVDSIAIAWALKHAGADVLCLTVGRTEQDFDPYWARKVAEHLRLPWEFLALPESDPALQALLDRTIQHIEQTSYSNVLMGMCCELLRDRMVATQRRIGYMGFWGDLLFGHKLQVTGSFNKLPLPEQTDANWTRQRMSTCWHTKPHTMQLAKGFRAGGETTWRVPFLHDHVAPWTFGLPRAYAPVAMNKPLLYGLMERYLPAHLCAWHVQKKIGFYTGAGAGKIRLTNPLLQDTNIRATYARLKARHS